MGIGHPESSLKNPLGVRPGAFAGHPRPTIRLPSPSVVQPLDMERLSSSVIRTKRRIVKPFKPSPGEVLAAQLYYFLTNGGMLEGSPTRMKKRANAWEKCSRKGESSRHRLPRLTAWPLRKGNGKL